MIETITEFIEQSFGKNPDEQDRLIDDEIKDSVLDEILFSDPEYLPWVARNERLPKRILSLLVCNPAVSVRREMAMRGRLDGVLFRQLSADVDEGVRARVAYNRRTPVEVLERLAGDADRFVAAIARERLGERLIILEKARLERNPSG